MKITAGDFNQEQLSDTINTPERNELICRKYAEMAHGKPALFFTSSIKHSEDLAAALCAHGLKAYPISGNTQDKERKLLNAAFKAGDIDGLTSCGVLNEGVDLPNAEVGCMCRPTKSGLLFRQQVGRILRPFPSPEDRAAGLHLERAKECAIIIDFCDVSAHHVLITAPTLFGLRADFDTKGKDLKKEAEEVEQLQLKYPTLDLALPNMDAVRSAIRNVDLLAPPDTPPEIKMISRLTWLKSSGVYHIGLMDHSMLSVREDALGKWEISRHNRGIRSVVSVHGSRDVAVKEAEKMIPQTDKMVLRSSASWKSEGPTQPQATRLWTLDPSIRRQYSEQEYYRFVTDQFDQGNRSYDKGSMSARISALVGQREV